MYCTSTMDIALAEEAMVSAKRMQVPHMIPNSAVMIPNPEIRDSIDFKKPLVANHKHLFAAVISKRDQILRR